MRLAPLGTEHHEFVESLLGDPAVLRFTGVPDPPPPGFAAEWIARYEAGRADGSKEGFVALDDDGAPVGMALGVHIRREAREVELGYIVAPAARGRGVGAALLRELTRWALEDLGALRVELVIDEQNLASQGIARRCGYALEGTHRSRYFKQGRRIDAQMWSRLPA